MKEYGAYEAKTHLSELLDLVSAGETITISRHGTPIAILMPFKTSQRIPPGETIQKLRDLREHIFLDGISLRDMIEEGRP